MIKNNPLAYPYPSQRTLVYGQEAMAASGSPLASQVGLDILKAGGNAIDSAIAMAMAHVVTEPTNNGLGSDCFAIFSFEGKIYGLNASGPAPRALTGQVFKDQGLDEVPTDGPLVSVVPGAVGGWKALAERFGTMSLKDLAAPAIRIAQRGYPVSPAIGGVWAQAVERFTPYRGQEAYQGFFDNFTIGGRAPRPGEVIRLPALAWALEEIGRTSGESFYSGQMAQATVDFLQAQGGLMEMEDLAAYRPEWVQPLSASYGGLEVWEIPPNGHGATVLMTLEILKNLGLEGKSPEEKTHLAIEALKLAYVDIQEYVAERGRMDPKIEALLDPAYLARRSQLVTDRALDPPVGRPSSSSTIYLAAADRQGNMVSFIQSNYMGFGSGLVVPDWGLALNNRVNNFSLKEGHPNYLVGGTRPYHTIIPGFLTQEGQPLGAFGVMGAFMQPQGQVQVLLRMVDEGLNPQAALDAPRWQWHGGRRVTYEGHFEEEVIEALRGRGHKLEPEEDIASMGRGQVILRDPDGVYQGGTEPRTDGLVLGI